MISVKIVKPELVKHIQHSRFKATALLATTSSNSPISKARYV